mgnify:CR=1 FL=1
MQNRDVVFWKTRCRTLFFYFVISGTVFIRVSPPFAFSASCRWIPQLSDSVVKAFFEVFFSPLKNARFCALILNFSSLFVPTGELRTQKHIDWPAYYYYPSWNVRVDKMSKWQKNDFSKYFFNEGKMTFACEMLWLLSTFLWSKLFQHS